MRKSFSHFWPWFFFAAAFESLLAIIALLLIPSESGLSLARLALLAILSSLLVLGIYWGLTARRASTRFDKFARAPLIFFSALLAWTSGLSLFLLRYLNPEKLLPYYERLGPLLWYALVVGIQAVIFLLLVKNGFSPEEFSKRRPIYTSALFVFGILLCALLFVVVTKIGVTPDTAYWSEPGVAIQGWQFVFSILTGFSILVCVLRFSFFQSSRLKNIIIPLVIWLIASILWLSVPMRVLQDSFYAPISPPANVPFPYSDAGFYDYLSQSLFVGTGYMGGIPPRPLYVLFLAALHFIFGQNYPAMVAAQTLALALFPVILYFLGKKLHSPAAGVTVAMLAIFREMVGLWISSNTRVVNSKIFTTDFPTAVAIAALCLVTIWWLERRSLKSALVAGGAFGLLMLFRTQSLLIAPVVFILAWLVYQRKTKEWILAGLTFAAAMIFTVLPWLVHNYTVTGKFSFDDPNQLAAIYTQYSFTGNLDASQFDFSKANVGGRLASFALENPGYVARFISTHFLNTEIGGLLALPLIKTFDGLLAPVNLYWVSWNGSLEWYNFFLIIFYLLVLAVGFAAARRRAGWIGLVPLAFNLGYALSNGVARFSGWRYNLPVDWVIYFYFAVGIIEILEGISLLLGAKEASGVSQNGMTQDSLLNIKQGNFIGQVKRAFPALLVFAFVGGLPWLAKGFAEPRYVSTREALQERLHMDVPSLGGIQTFLSQPGAVLLEGRMLYPRMYYRNEGLISKTPWAAYAVRPYARIGFILLNDKRTDAIFITRDLPDFRQGADVIILGCQLDGYVEARVVDFGDSNFQNAPLSVPCE